MSDKTATRLGNGACGFGGVAILLGVVVPLVAGSQGGHGGGTTVLGVIAEAVLGGVAILLGLIGAMSASTPPARRRAFAGIGLGLVGPVLFLLFAVTFVRANAYRI